MPNGLSTPGLSNCKMTRANLGAKNQALISVHYHFTKNLRCFQDDRPKYAVVVRYSQTKNPNSRRTLVEAAGLRRRGSRRTALRTAVSPAGGVEGFGQFGWRKSEGRY